MSAYEILNAALDRLLLAGVVTLAFFACVRMVVPGYPQLCAIVRNLTPGRRALTVAIVWSVVLFVVLVAGRPS